MPVGTYRWVQSQEVARQEVVFPPDSVRYTTTICLIGPPQDQPAQPASRPTRASTISQPDATARGAWRFTVSPHR